MTGIVLRYKAVNTGALNVLKKRSAIEDTLTGFFKRDRVDHIKWPSIGDFRDEVFLRFIELVPLWNPNDQVVSALDGVMRASPLVGYTRLVDFAGSDLAEIIRRAQRDVDAERVISDNEIDHPPTRNDIFKLNSDGLPYEPSDENDEYEFDSEGDTNVEVAVTQSRADSSSSVSEVYRSWRVLLGLLSPKGRLMYSYYICFYPHLHGYICVFYFILCPI